MVNKRLSLILQHGVVWLMATVLFAWLLAYPIRMLNGSGEFEWGSAGLLAMIKDLMGKLLYGFQYFGAHSSAVLVCVFLIVLVCLTGFALWVKPATSRKQLLLSLSFLGINLVLVVVHQIITGSQAPVGRKSIYLIPVLFTPFVLGLSLVSQKTLSILLGTMICGLLLFHTFRPHSWLACREWYYDAYYPEMLSSIIPAETHSDSVRIGSSWIFNPSLTFYQKTLSLPLSGLVYQKPLVIDSSMQYYYVEQADTIGMYLHGFLLDKNIGPFFLFKKVSAP
jgi:hypothetical protein